MKISERSEFVHKIVCGMQEDLLYVSRKAVTFEQEIGKLKTKDHVQDAEIHNLQQTNVNNDVFMMRFPKEPTKNEVVELIAKEYEVEPTDIKKFYAFRTAVRPQKPSASSTPSTDKFNNSPSFNVVITFDNYAKKMEFMEKKKDKGPLKVKQLQKFKLADENLNVEIAEKSIRVVNRLTKFNLDAQKRINETKDIHQWEKIQFHNGLFRVKKERGNWKNLATYTDLDALGLASSKINEKKK